MNIQISEEAINRVSELANILQKFALGEFTNWNDYELFKLNNKSFKIVYCENKQELTITNDEGLRVYLNNDSSLELY